MPLPVTVQGCCGVILSPQVAVPLSDGELALLLIRLSRSLSVLVGNDPLQLRHWFHTANRHTGGVPAEQVQRTDGLVEIVHDLDAIHCSAYYGLLFWEGLIDPPPEPIRRRQTLLFVLRDPLDYGLTQQLGAWMRDHGVEAFETLNARSSDALVQVAVLTPVVFQSTPFNQVELTAELTADHTSYPYHDDGQLHHFPRELFLMAGQLPRATETIRRSGASSWHCCQPGRYAKVWRTPSRR